MKLFKPELLSPCGDTERLYLAIKYGANAVYLGANEFTMRAAPKNFNKEELKNAVEYAHSKNVKVYLTCNTFPHSASLENLPEFLRFTQSCNIDALIIADLGVLSIAKKVVPNMEIHISTQAGIVNYESARMYYDLGAKRVVTARELSLEEIAEIRAKTNKELELECFVHGAMCMSFSGRCLMSNFMIGRDANLGECAQPCRWQFEVTDISRPNVSYPVEYDNGGTYFMNSRDMRMIEYIPQLIEAGIDSFKIEGRAKSAYYTSVVTNAYRCAIDDCLKNYNENYSLPVWILQETEKVSHRQYSTGFYFSHPNSDANIDYNGGYISEWDVAAFVENCDGKIITLSQRNKFNVNDELEVLEVGKPPVAFKICELFDEELKPVESANHAMMTIKIKSDLIFAKNSIVRKKKK